MPSKALHRPVSRHWALKQGGVKTIYEHFRMEVNQDSDSTCTRPELSTYQRSNPGSWTLLISWEYSFEDHHIWKDFKHRIRAAHSAFDRFSQRVYFNPALTMIVRTKIMVFHAIVLSPFLYASETWTLYRRDFKCLVCFQQPKLRQILNVRWDDHITNNEVLR